MKIVQDIRDQFSYLLATKTFVTLPNDVKTIEISPAFFLANEPTIFGEVNHDYVRREIAWYESMSLNVNDIEGEVPAIWKKVATHDGFINSNYGWAIYHKDNGNQYGNVLDELRRDPSSRRGVMVYTRPGMHVEQHTGGMQDFMCTNSVQYVIRYGVLHAYVSMRSNDAYHGYRNDFAWQQHVLTKLAADLEVEEGEIWWFAGSLHFYESAFKFIK